MKNKKGNIAIGAIVMFLIGAVIWTIAFNEVEPLIEEVLLELDNSVVCPPEFSSEDYNICISAKGEIILNGILNEDLELKTEGNDFCTIQKGAYNNQQICILKDLHETKNLYLTGMSVSKITTGKKLLSYTKSGKYIKMLKFVKYIPKCWCKEP